MNLKESIRGQLARPQNRVALALAIVLVAGVIFNGGGAFFGPGTHRDALRQLSVYGILACGMAVVVLSGGIDLAVGSILALSAVLLSKLLMHHDVAPVLALLAVLGAGAAAGLTSGALVSLGRLQAFIATLAVMVSSRGLAKLISGGQKVATYVPQGDGSFKTVEVPGLYRVIDSKLFGGSISVVTLIFIACFIATLVLMTQTKWGREVYAIGGNEEAARLSGINVKWSKTLAYVYCGLCAAIAGICQAAQEQQGDPEAGLGYELTAISMIVMGGMSLAGGRGSVGLALFGILAIGYLEKILSINAVPESGRLLITGAIIVIAVLSQARKQ